MAMQITQERGQLGLAEGAVEARHRWPGLPVRRLDAVEDDADRVAWVGFVDRAAERQVDRAWRAAPDSVGMTGSAGAGKDRAADFLAGRRLWRLALGGPRP